VTCHCWDSQVCGGFSFHGCAALDVFYTTIMTSSYILTCCDIVRGSYKSFHHRGTSHCECVWVHKKRQSGQIFDEIRVNFALRFNKAAPPEANLCKLEKKSIRNQFSVRCKTKWRTTEICRCRCQYSFEESVVWSPRKFTNKYLQNSRFQEPPCDV
jgi:hypothetical protein